jgi:membrane-anchored protein YejM (alkaline phosphatase superfamily)
LSARHPWAALALVVCLSFLGIRGSLDRKALNPVHAYEGHSFALGNLALNGVFTASRGIVHGSRSLANPLSMEAACAELGLDPQAPYPVLRPHPAVTSDRPNIIMILLESWDTSYLGCFGDKRGLTPSFDRIAEKSRLYVNLFASSQRTIGAVQALLSGIPVVPGVPEFGRGLEHTNTTRVGRLAKEHGYHTVFIQAPYRTSYYLDAVMASLGFDEIYGKGEIPLLRDYGGQDAKWGWDYDMLQFAADRFDSLPEPFLAVIFTGTTHSPYADPGKEFRVADHQPHGEGGYLNTLVYADWAIGEFFERARESKWYRRSVFLLGSDHVHRVGSTDLRKAFHIPFLIHGAGIEPMRVPGIYSQLDVLPALVALMGLPEPYASIGVSLTGESSGMALVKQGDRLGIISDWGELTHAVEERMEAKITDPRVPEDRLDELERRLLAIHKVTVALVRENRWAPADPAPAAAK